MSVIKLVLVLVLGLSVAACSGNGPTAGITSPSPVIVAPAPGPAVTMKGTVYDTAFHELPGARIEIVNGPSAGLTTMSDAKGQWGFPGAFDDTSQFRATKDGYEPATLPLGPYCAACNPNRWVNFVMKALARPVNVAGSYSMTIKAASTCSNLPEAVRARTYGVTLSSLDNGSPNSAANAYFTVSATGANFVPDWNRFEGGVSGNYLGFWFEILVEEVAPGNYLIFGMSAGGALDTDHPETIEIQGDGGISYCTVDATSGVLDDCFRGRATVATCESPHQTLVLTPR